MHRYICIVFANVYVQKPKSSHASAITSAQSMHTCHKPGFDDHSWESAVIPNKAIFNHSPHVNLCQPFGWIQLFIVMLTFNDLLVEVGRLSSCWPSLTHWLELVLLIWVNPLVDDDIFAHWPSFTHWLELVLWILINRLGEDDLFIHWPSSTYLLELVLLIWINQLSEDNIFAH